MERTFALVGPGRAGTTVGLALTRAGWTCTGVAGRTVDAPSTRAAARQLHAPAVDTRAVGSGAAVVVVASPDADISAVAATVAPALEPSALVIHLSGARGIDALAAVPAARPDVEVGALHPLQSLPTAELGADRLRGSWAAVEGSARVDALASSALGLRTFRVAADRRIYHAAATVASNHLVALLGQLDRLAAAAGVPFEAFLALARASLDNVAALGPAGALTGPVARGDAATVGGHLAALPADETDAYRALAREALRLSGRDDAALEALLEATVARA
jgi:predicted short-subunit dehydrogenase-like oxidoreductase (DUF2520 family)